MLKSKSIFTLFLFFYNFTSDQKKAYGESMNRSLSRAVGLAPTAFFILSHRHRADGKERPKEELRLMQSPMSIG